MLKIILLLTCFFSVVTVHAGEAIDRVLADQRVHEPVQYMYQETRHIQLLDKPWLASGMMLMSPSFFILEQVQPHRLVMASSRTTMWLYDYKNNRQRTRSITRSSNGSLALAGMMMALRTGDVERIKSRYQLNLIQKDSRWKLVFVPLDEALRQSYAKIVLGGDLDHAADEFEVEYADGNRTLWRMNLLPNKGEIDNKIKQLVNEARGG